MFGIFLDILFVLMVVYMGLGVRFAFQAAITEKARHESP